MPPLGATHANTLKAMYNTAVGCNLVCDILMNSQP